VEVDVIGLAGSGGIAIHGTAQALLIAPGGNLTRRERFRNSLKVQRFCKLAYLT
jgi:hypothetical protein